MEKLLLFHLDDSARKKIKQIAKAQKIRCEFVEPSSYLLNLEDIVSGRRSPAALVAAVEESGQNPAAKAKDKETSQECARSADAAYHGEVPDESLLLLCGFTETRMDKLLAALRNARVQVDYKAVLTPTNRRWNVMRLLLEMRAEKAAYEKRGKGD